MASLAASVAASMVIDDMLKDDGGVEATELMEGYGYKRKDKRKKSHVNMGSVIAKTVARQVAKQAGRQVAKQVTKRVTKQAVKRLAIRGAKELGKGAAVAAGGVGADAAINKMRGGRRRRYRKKRGI